MEKWRKKIRQNTLDAVRFSERVTLQIFKQNSTQCSETDESLSVKLKGLLFLVQVSR